MERGGKHSATPLFSSPGVHAWVDLIHLPIYGHEQEWLKPTRETS
jgi:hypothetical protein